jgi:MFS family permease
MQDSQTTFAPEPIEAGPLAVEKSSPPSWLSWSVWGIAALFYFGGFYLRVTPAMMTDELMQAFGIGAGSLANLTAFYLYAYVAMQIPIGILLDSWGPRKLLIAGSIAAAAGTALFGSTDNFALACAGRALIGGAVAVGWLVTLKLATHWFPASRFATISGLGLMFGNLGALVGQVPLRLAIQQFGWRAAIFFSAGMVLLIGVLAFLFVKNDPLDDGYKSYAPLGVQRKHLSVWELLKGFRHVFAYRNTWLIFFAQGSLVGSILAFTGLWGTPFLRARYGLQPARAAAVASVMTVCWALASPLCGALSDKLGRRKPICIGGCLLAAAGWSAMFYIDGLPLPLFIAIGAFTSLATGANVLGFAYAKESVSAQFLGSISGTTNIGNMMGPTLLIPAIGWVLDREWRGTINHGVHVYDLHAFRYGFALTICWLLASSVLLSFTRETYCRQSA